MKYLKSLLFSVFFFSGLTTIYAQTVIVKNITNTSTSDFIVFSGDYTLEDKLINTSPNDIDDFLKTIGNSITVSSGQTRPLNEQFQFNAGVLDKQLYFINNNTKTLQYAFAIGLLPPNNQLWTMLYNIHQAGDDIENSPTQTQNIYTIDLIIGNDVSQSNITFR